METKIKHSLIESMRLQIRFYQVAIIGLVLVLAIAMPVLYWGLKHQKIIVVPAMLKSPIAFSDVSIDASGLQQMALDLVYARYNVTPELVDANYGYLLTFADTEIHPALKALLASDATAIKKQKITASFYVSSVKVDAANLKVKVTGTLQEYSGILGITNNKMPDQHKVFILTLQYNAGQLLLQSWDEDKKDET